MMAFHLQRPKLVMFDLDGTLLDTVPDISVALDQALQHCGYASVGLQAARGWVGNGSRKLIIRALAHVCQQPEQQLADTLIDRVQEQFFHYYELCCYERSKPYAGVHEALTLLHNHAIDMVCITNKPARFSAKVLAAAGMADYFSLLLSGDSLAKRKPDPMPLHYALEQRQCLKHHALMVGDSRNDVLAARAAGVPVLGVDYGYNYERPLPAPDTGFDDAPDYRVSSLGDFFRQLLP